MAGNNGESDWKIVCFSHDNDIFIVLFLLLAASFHKFCYFQPEDICTDPMVTG